VGGVKDTHTPPRSVRVDDALWASVKECAAAEGKTVTDVVVAALRRYVARSAQRGPVGG
jgi:hypothetical protein